MNYPFELIEPVYRPPSEAESLLIQVTIGCSHNACTFCAMYRNKKYKVRALEEIVSDIRKAAHYFAQCGEAPRKIFLCDGDALAAPTEFLLAVLDELNASFPRLTRVGIYASARNVLGKSREELGALCQKKLRIAYLGVESGSDEVLSMVNKGASSEETSRASLQIKEAGWKVSQIVMLGVGGRALSRQHCRESAKLISKTAPQYLSFLTTVVVPDTPYMSLVQSGRVELLTVKELLEEMRDIIESVALEKDRIIFRANHVSNLLPLEGVLPRDKDKLSSAIMQWINKCPDGIYPENDPRKL